MQLSSSNLVENTASGYNFIDFGTADVGEKSLFCYLSQFKIGDKKSRLPSSFASWARYYGSQRQLMEKLYAVRIGIIVEMFVRSNLLNCWVTQRWEDLALIATHPSKLVEKIASLKRCFRMLGADEV